MSISVVVRLGDQHLPALLRNAIEQAGDGGKPLMQLDGASAAKLCTGPVATDGRISA